MVQQHGLKINAYNAYNGIFQAHVWVNSCTKQSQALTFAGFKTHHKNGMSERRIRHLQNFNRTQLIHAEKICLSSITAKLWP